jgi:DNA-binding NtrC family response regulator
MKNVLMIDKDVNHLAVLAVALIEAGYKVIPEIDAESAVAVLREDVRIDLIIIDYQVPGLNALSFMTMLRELMPKVPVIVLAQHCDMDIYLKVMSLGAFEYLNKPVRACELTRIVKVALEAAGPMIPCIYARASLEIMRIRERTPFSRVRSQNRRE